MAKILIACEYSGASRRAWEALGHDVISCDLLPADDGASNHYQGDVNDIINDGFDLMIAHPPCTFLCNSGVGWLYKKEGRWAQMEEGAKFFKSLKDSSIPLIAVENPIMHKYAVAIIGERQTQIIQPWMFGHYEKKATGLWLKGLPLLVPTTNLKAETDALPLKVQQRLHYLPPSPDRWKLRSETYSGIANAMATQWSVLLVPS